ncbi:MAG: hypothetical protein OHK0046_17980 [Anaerolineae bacterium]
MAKIEDVVMRIMTDTAFAEELLADPETTLRQEGIEPTEDILSVLKGLDVDALKQLAEKFNNQGIAM